MSEESNGFDEIFRPVRIEEPLEVRSGLARWHARMAGGVVKMRIRIRWKSGELEADLKDTPTAKKLISVLPCGSLASTWGEEVYFEVPVKAVLEEGAHEVVEPGTVCFWLQGNSLALPYGRTPISKGDECRLAARCNILGRILGDPRKLRSVKDGDKIQVQLSG